MNVFIGGSRAVSKLNAVIRARLDDLIKRGCTILIGDANGADKAVQQHLAEANYPNVVVFCMEECRNNVGNWLTRSIEPPSKRRDFTYYAAKDLVMPIEAQCGVMVGFQRGHAPRVLGLRTSLTQPHLPLSPHEGPSAF